MGGTVAVFHRGPDGKETMMYRHTSMIGWYPQSLRFCEKDSTWNDFMYEPWEDMRADMEENGPDGPFDYNMTDVYIPSDLYTPIAPYGYGLVVFDQVNDVILSSQGYTSFDYISASELSLDLTNHILGPTEEERAVTRFKNLYNSTRITSAEIVEYPNGSVNSDNYRYVTISLHPYSMDELFDLLVPFDRKSGNKMWRFMRFNIDMYPFTVENFGEFDVSEQKRFMERVRSLDIELNDRDIDAWEEWFEWCER